MGTDPLFSLFSKEHALSARGVSSDDHSRFDLEGFNENLKNSLETETKMNTKHDKAEEQVLDTDMSEDLYIKDSQMKQNNALQGKYIDSIGGKGSEKQNHSLLKNYAMASIKNIDSKKRFTLGPLPDKNRVIGFINESDSEKNSRDLLPENDMSDIDENDFRESRSILLQERDVMNFTYRSNLEKNSSNSLSRMSAMSEINKSDLLQENYAMDCIDTGDSENFLSQSLQENGVMADIAQTNSKNSPIRSLQKNYIIDSVDRSDSGSKQGHSLTEVGVMGDNDENDSGNSRGPALQEDDTIDSTYRSNSENNQSRLLQENGSVADVSEIHSEMSVNHSLLENDRVDSVDGSDLESNQSPLLQVNVTLASTNESNSYSSRSPLSQDNDFMDSIDETDSRNNPSNSTEKEVVMEISNGDRELNTGNSKNYKIEEEMKLYRKPFMDCENPFEVIVPLIGTRVFPSGGNTQFNHRYDLALERNSMRGEGGKVLDRQMAYQRRQQCGPRNPEEKLREAKKLYHEDLSTAEYITKIAVKILEVMQNDKVDEDAMEKYFKRFLSVPTSTRSLLYAPHMIHTIMYCRGSTYFSLKLRSLANECYHKCHVMFPIPEGYNFETIYTSEILKIVPEKFDRMQEFSLEYDDFDPPDDEDSAFSEDSLISSAI